jgi:adenylate cyclase
VRYAVEHGVGLGGEVREVSALFVDVVGSTAMAQRLAPTEVVALLNELFRLVVRAVGGEGGWVNKFEGDAALCVFGAPMAQPDHAARALRAARRLRDDLMAWGGLDVGIGVSSGPAVAGNVGAEERYEYTVIGDPVNEAARLSEAAKAVPQRALASSGAVGAAGTGGWLPAGALALRGRSEPTEVFAAPLRIRTGPR